MDVWQLGNTSVRSALRLRDGLTALASSSLQGNIRKKEGDEAFRRLLGERGVVSLGKDATNSVGRKWRSAMAKLGFLYPPVEKSWKFAQNDLGPMDMITPAGRALIMSETVPAMHECFLRALATPLSLSKNGQTFSPLRWTLAIIIELYHQKEDASISFMEMSCIVQATDPIVGLEQTVERIKLLRQQRATEKRKKGFDKEYYSQVSLSNGYKPATLRDYADMNIRYLKATGMVQSKGKGISLIPEKRSLAVELAQHLLSNQPLLELYRSLCLGAPLPTDELPKAREILKDLLQKATTYGLSDDLDEKDWETSQTINRARYRIEERINNKKEELYASQQERQWREIASYMNLIASNKRKYNKNSIPYGEAPAYLEWSIWRAFLAIDTLVNKPFKVRCFQVDQDFLPVGTAPGGGPDLIAEFSNCVLVIEVTLSESSRQEAMEGEPVRRHVADLMQQYDKPVYGLFIANRIDTNTAETFRKGVWYTQNDYRQNLLITPLTLEQFSNFFQTIFETGQARPETIIKLIEECQNARCNLDSPSWKKEIENIVSRRIAFYKRAK